MLISCAFYRRDTSEPYRTRTMLGEEHRNLLRTLNYLVTLNFDFLTFFVALKWPFIQYNLNMLCSRRDSEFLPWYCGSGRFVGKVFSCRRERWGTAAVTIPGTHPGTAAGSVHQAWTGEDDPHWRPIRPLSAWDSLSHSCRRCRTRHCSRGETRRLHVTWTYHSPCPCGYCCEDAGAVTEPWFSPHLFNNSFIVLVCIKPVFLHL